MTTLNTSSNIKIIIDSLSKLSLYELNSLIVEIENSFNIKISNDTSNLNNIQSTNTSTIVDDKAKEEQLTFKLILNSIQSSDKKISVIKIVRTITGLGLKESKDLVEATPKILKENLSKEECEKLQKDIDLAGGITIIE